MMVMDNFKVSCSDLGSLSVINTCPIPVEQRSTLLANGWLMTWTLVDSNAQLTRDVKDIKEALTDSNYALAQYTYLGGKHSQKYNAIGNPTTSHTLQEFSTTALEGTFDY